MTQKAHLEKSLSQFTFTPEAHKYLGEIEQSFSQDFIPARGGYFSNETMQEITALAIEKLSLDLQGKPQPIDFQTLRQEWNAVLVDYHRQNNWNFEGQNKKPKRALTENQKVAREMFPYFAIIVGTAFIVKTAFFYYGMHAASNPTPENKVWLVITMILFFGSLFYFAWKKKK